MPNVFSGDSRTTAEIKLAVSANVNSSDRVRN